MTDYTHSTGASGTMLIRDLGYNIEFWINANNSTTWSDHIPWSWTTAFSSASNSFYYHPNSGWQKVGTIALGFSSNVTFALGNTGTSGFGGPTSFTVYINRATVPPAPQPVMLDSITSTSIRASFNGNGDGGSAVDTWEIGYGTDPNTPQSTQTTSPVVISGLTPGTTYYFWARGHNAIGWGPYSARTSATTLNTPAPPSIPVLSNIGPTSMDASFNANDTGGSAITGFEIGYGTDPDTPTTTVSATSPKTISGLAPATTYYIRARAQNSVGWSAWSAAGVAMTIAGIRIKVSGVWKFAVPYVRTGGIWKRAIPWQRNAGTWKETI